MSKVYKMRTNIIQLILSSKSICSLEVYNNKISPILDLVSKTKDNTELEKYYNELKNIFNKLG